MNTGRALESLQRIIILGEKLLTIFDIEELLTSTVRDVKELLSVEGATLYLIEPIEKLMISHVILSDRVEEIILKIDNTSIAGFTALSRKSLHIPDVYADLLSIHPELKFNKSVDDSTNHRTRNMLTQPLIIKDELIGVFQVVNKLDSDFDDNDIMILKNFSVVAGISIMNARLMERVMDEQSNAFSIVEHISDKVIVQDAAGKILHMNRSAADILPENMNTHECRGRNFLDIFPQFSGIEKEIRKLIDQNLDKTVSGGKTPFIILSSKNQRGVVEKIILIIKSQLAPLSEPDAAPPDPRLSND